jgi:hypothetical protein
MSQRTRTKTSGRARSTKTSKAAASTGASASAVAVIDTEPAFGWRKLRLDWWKAGDRDEDAVSKILKVEGARSIATGGRCESHDLEVTLGIDHVPPGFYEVKRLHVRDGKYVDRRFKAGQRGERIYGRRDAEIKSFATALEDYLDTCLWGVEAVTDTHAFIDQALLRKHGKKFHERLMRLAKAAADIPTLSAPAWKVLVGSVRPQDIEAGFSSLSGIFIIADHIYTLVKPSEYTRFIGFDSGSAEGPKLSFQGVVPLNKFARKKVEGKR